MIMHGLVNFKLKSLSAHCIVVLWPWFFLLIPDWISKMTWCDDGNKLTIWYAYLDTAHRSASCNYMSLETSQTC